MPAVSLRAVLDGQLTEKALMQAIVDLARLRGYAAYHTFDSRRSRPGFPDLVLVKPPYLVFAECKTEKGRVTPAQQWWLDALHACGQTAFVWRPSDWRSGEIDDVLLGGIGEATA